MEEPNALLDIHRQILSPSSKEKEKKINTPNSQILLKKKKSRKAPKEIEAEFGRNTSPQLLSLGLQQVYVCDRAFSERRKQRKREKRHEKKKKKSLICFSTVGAPTLASSWMQSLFCANECALWGGWGPYKRMVGGKWSLHSPCPPKLVFCSLPPCFHHQPPPLPFPPLILSFRESSFWDLPIVASEGTDLLRGGLGSSGSHCQVSPVGDNQVTLAGIYFRKKTKQKTQSRDQQ